MLFVFIFWQKICSSSFKSHWPASAALALGILGWTDDIVTMGAERMIPTLVKGVAVFPTIAPTVPVLLRLLTLADKLLWVDQDLPDALLCPRNLFWAPRRSRLPFYIWDMEIQDSQNNNDIHLSCDWWMIALNFIFQILCYQQQEPKREEGWRGQWRRTFGREAGLEECPKAFIKALYQRPHNSHVLYQRAGALATM